MALQIEKLDKIFSDYIRLRNVDWKGWTHCYICGQPSYWKYLENGHFIPRGNMSLRFDGINCHECCYDCNVNKDGNLIEYEKKLLSDYGAEKVENLKRKQHETTKFTQSELNDKIVYYTKRVNELKKFN